MKKILVTGATGFIGNYVVETLLRKGLTVIATSRSQEKARTFSWFKNVRYIPFDLGGFEASTDYFTYFGSPDLMIHLAWEGLPNYKASFHEELNLPLHYAFLKNLIGHGLKDLTVTGTCFEYGMQEGQLSENMPAMPENPYARAKNELQVLLRHLQAQNDFAFKWVRLFYMYGKGQSLNSLIPQLEAAVNRGEQTFNMSGGEQVRDFLPVETVAGHIVTISLQSEVTGIINCCSGVPVKVKDFIANYLRESKRTIGLNLGYYPYPDYEPMCFWGDPQKLKSIIE